MNSILNFGDEFGVQLWFNVFGEVVCLCFWVERFEDKFGILIQIFIDGDSGLEYFRENVLFESEDDIELFGHYLN